MSTKKKPSYAKKYRNHNVLIVTENGTINEHPVFGIDSGTIETDTDMLPVVDSKKFYNETTGGFTYLFHMDIPAKVESENIKQLRRSNVIKNLMNYDKEKPLDMFKLMPYLIAVVAVIF